MRCVHTVKRYAALKRKGIQTHATTRMKPKDIMLSDLNKSQKANAA